MKKVLTFFSFLLLTFLLVGCTNNSSVPVVSSDDASGIMVELGTDSPAWGDSTQVICNNGAIYKKFKNVDFAYLMGQASAKDLKGLKKDLGENTIHYSKHHDDPNAFDDEVTVTLDYVTSNPAVEIDDDTYAIFSRKIQEIVKKNEDYFALNIKKTSRIDFLVEWRDSTKLSFTELIGDKFDTTIDVVDLNDEQQGIIKRMDEDFKKKDLKIGVSEYTIRENDSILTLKLYGNFFSITTWPKINLTMDTLISKFSFDPDEVKALGSSGDFSSVDIAKVADQQSIEDIKNHQLGNFRLLWPDGDRHKVGEFLLQLGFKKVPSEQICE